MAKRAVDKVKVIKDALMGVIGIDGVSVETEVVYKVTILTQSGKEKDIDRILQAQDVLGAMLKDDRIEFRLKLKIPFRVGFSELHTEYGP